MATKEAKFTGPDIKKGLAQAKRNPRKEVTQWNIGA